jgi:HD-like signal output (HDOD) protein
MISLPILPQVYHQIVALDRDSKSDLQDWIDAIQVDPLSSAQVIRRAHSPLYGFQGEINKINKAVILLGKNAVKEIIVSGALKRSFESVKEEGFEIEDYWLHSVGVALAARLLSFPLDENRWTPEQRQEFQTFALDEVTLAALRKLNLAERLPLIPHQDPFIGGMMHDIGKVALVHSYPGLFPMIIQDLETKSWNAPMRFSEETVAGGADHALVGRILAQSWKLGDDLVRMVEGHHTPGLADPFTRLVALANFLGGGIYPYPGKAAFPLVGHFRQGSGATPPPAGEETPGAPAAAVPPEETILRLFLPEGLLEKLDLQLADLVGLGRLLVPVVRRLAEDLRKSI